VAKITDPKTGKERDETADEIKAREAAESQDDDDGAGDDDVDVEKLKADLKAAKADSRKWEKRAKDNFASKIGLPWDEVTKAAQKFTELDARSKTDAEKAEEARKAAEAEAANVKTELLRLRVAMKKGLTDGQAKRLVGSTEEELEADADELLETFKGKDDGEDNGGAARSGRQSPRERMKSGAARPREEPSQNNAKDIVDQAMALEARR
jgi:hypothetical protein